MNQDRAANECAANWLLALLFIEVPSCVVNVAREVSREKGWFNH